MNSRTKYIFKYLFFAYAAWFLIPYIYFYVTGYWASLGVPEFLQTEIQSGNLSYLDVNELYFKPLKILLVLVSFSVIGLIHGYFFHYLLYPLLALKTLYYAWFFSLMSGLTVESKPVEGGLGIENILFSPINWLSLNAELLAIGLVPLLLSIWAYKKTYNKYKHESAFSARTSATQPPVL